MDIYHCFPIIVVMNQMAEVEVAAPVELAVLAEVEVAAPVEQAGLVELVELVGLVEVELVRGLLPGA
jgi:hypothetical protein